MSLLVHCQVRKLLKTGGVCGEKMCRGKLSGPGSVEGSHDIQAGRCAVNRSVALRGGQVYSVDRWELKTRGTVLLGLIERGSTI